MYGKSTSPLSDIFPERESEFQSGSWQPGIAAELFRQWHVIRQPGVLGVLCVLLLAVPRVERQQCIKGSHEKPRLWKPECRSCNTGKHQECLCKAGQVAWCFSETLVVAATDRASLSLLCPSAPTSISRGRKATWTSQPIGERNQPDWHKIHNFYWGVGVGHFMAPCTFCYSLRKQQFL